MLNVAQTAMPSLFKKYYFRFSVRTLLAATTVFGALLGLIGNEANRLRLHRQAERTVHELGGRYLSVAGDEYGARRGPFWCPVVDDSLYADFEYVWFTSTNNAGLQDRDLAVLKNFPRLKDLQIAAPLITDEALVHIEGIKSLRALELYKTRVTSRGLRRLGESPIEKLVLAGPNVTDETLGSLEAFPTLRKLMITESSVTDVGLAHLRHVPDLEKLFLADSPICDAGIIHLSKLTHLHELDLIDLAITDEGISPLADLPRLQYLDVMGTRTTEAGLLAFSKARTLKHLGIGPQATPDTVKNLSAALPGCQVFDSSGFRCMQGW